MIIRAQFHQRSRYSFYVGGAQKRKKTDDLTASSVFLRFWAPCKQRLGINMLVKSTPGGERGQS